MLLLWCYWHNRRPDTTKQSCLQIYIESISIFCNITLLFTKLSRFFDTVGILLSKVSQTSFWSGPGIYCLFISPLSHFLLTSLRCCSNGCHHFPALWRLARTTALALSGWMGLLTAYDHYRLWRCGWRRWHTVRVHLTTWLGGRGQSVDFVTVDHHERGRVD